MKYLFSTLFSSKLDVGLCLSLFLLPVAAHAQDEASDASATEPAATEPAAVDSVPAPAATEESVPDATLDGPAPAADSKPTGAAEPTSVSPPPTSSPEGSTTPDSTVVPSTTVESTPAKPNGSDAATNNDSDRATERTTGSPREMRAGRNRAMPTPKVFGKYRIRLNISQPKFDDGQKYYEKFYGAPKMYPTLAADWFAWDWFVTLGIGFRGSYYSTSGHPVLQKTFNKDSPDPDTFTFNENTRETLTFIPLQALLTMEFTPFEKKWVVIDGWLGMEYAYWQVVRADEVGDSTATAPKTTFGPTAASLLQVAPTTTTEDPGDLVNKGWKSATVVGIAANILLNPLEDRAAKSLAPTMGLGYIYLSPFMEIIRSTNKKGLSLGRSVIGVGFTFESLR